MNNFEELYIKYLPMINKLSCKYEGIAAKYSIEFDDLVQIGAIALLYSMNSYDKSKGMLFSSYVYQNIEFYIKKELMKFNRSIEIVSLEDYIKADINLELQVLEKVTYTVWKNEIIKYLPRLWSKVLILKAFHNKSIKEISIELDQDQAAINRVIHKSKYRLLKRSKVIKVAYDRNRISKINLFRRPHDVIYLL